MGGARGTRKRRERFTVAVYYGFIMVLGLTRLLYKCPPIPPSSPAPATHVFLACRGFDYQARASGGGGWRLRAARAGAERGGGQGRVHWQPRPTRQSAPRAWGRSHCESPGSPAPVSPPPAPGSRGARCPGHSGRGGWAHLCRGWEAVESTGSRRVPRPAPDVTRAPHPDSPPPGAGPACRGRWCRAASAEVGWCRTW